MDMSNKQMWMDAAEKAPSAVVEAFMDGKEVPQEALDTAIDKMAVAVGKLRPRRLMTRTDYEEALNRV